jgi:hypothetical protein
VYAGGVMNVSEMEKVVVRGGVKLTNRQVAMWKFLSFFFDHRLGFGQRTSRHTQLEPRWW